MEPGAPLVNRTLLSEVIRHLIKSLPFPGAGSGLDPGETARVPCTVAKSHRHD